MSGAFVYNNEKNTLVNNEPPSLSSSFAIEEKKPIDNNELPCN
jgi:hypothetical protein